MYFLKVIFLLFFRYNKWTDYLYRATQLEISTFYKELLPKNSKAPSSPVFQECEFSVRK
ncbi:hypothetical protein LMANV2_80113 [Leptospira interrogans serovar Manilae]|uniref:Uncharacterized protein n=1 Tax=Leptospira interrogans serovar Manilae TaxID=214675 RepID=A0AAQ1SQT5_LEPIR|nr:hypothetical protein LMANV2_80113 [Leptospira interrogans serovar Manilae]